MRILCYVNHFYGKNTLFSGKSSSQEPAIRKKIVEKTLESLEKIPNIEIILCGVGPNSLLPLQLDFNNIEDPRFLVYESLNHMINNTDNYDYFINIEDDIILPEETIQNIFEFDKHFLINECLLPNRIEVNQDKRVCIDLVAKPGWTSQMREFNGSPVRVALNAHSGISILSREKIQYLKNYVDLTKKELIIGGYMASAYAKIHSPFCMYRYFNELHKNIIIHQDHWVPEPQKNEETKENNNKPSVSKNILSRCINKLTRLGK